MVEKYTDDYVEGYTKAKEEDKEEINKAYEISHKYEHEYAILKEENAKNSNFIRENIQYVELGKALKTILDYMKEGVE